MLKTGLVRLCQKRDNGPQERSRETDVSAHPRTGKDVVEQSTDTRERKGNSAKSKKRHRRLEIKSVEDGKTEGAERHSGGAPLVLKPARRG